MANKDLLGQLQKAMARKLGITEGEVSLPEELVERLEKIGLGVGESSGLKIISLGKTQTHSGSGLENYLERMNTDQLKLVSRRYNPRANATRMEAARRAIQEALSKPDLLAEMIANLSLLELELLQLVKQGGGRTDGWDLIIHAALQGFPVPQIGVSNNWYKMHLARSDGVAYLGTLLRDGLLLPISFAAPWFDSYGFMREKSSPEESTVLLDPRLQAVLPEKEIAPAYKPLKLGAVSAQPLGAHPVRAIIELQETIKLTLEEEKIQVTREGRIGKQAVARMAKKRPWLESLERNLEIMLRLGLILPASEAKDLYKPRLESCIKLLQVPLAWQYFTLMTGFLDSYEPTEHSWQRNPDGVYSAAVGRRALLQGLNLLPEHPVSLDEALDGLWEQLLHCVGEVGSGYYYGGERKVSLPGWYRKTLLGDFSSLGLVALAPLHKDGYALEAGLGLKWFNQGKLLGDLMSRRQQNPELSPLPESETLRHMGLDPKTGQPLERPLLVQPNFEVLVYLDKLSPLALLTLACADCTRIDAQTASFTLSRSSVYRALESGLKLDTLLDQLQAHSATPVPASIPTSLREWAERRERLSVQENTRLLEFPSTAERDAALAQTKGKAIGERFVQVSGATRLPKDVLRHSYTGVPGRSLRFEADGRFRIKGASDLAARAIIASLAQPNPDGSYSFNRAALSRRSFDAVREAFLARVDGGLPPQLDALLGIWEGKTTAPIVAKVSLFQHPSATALAKHPELAKHLDSPISPTTYLIKTGREAGLDQALKALGIAPTSELVANLKAQAIQGSIMQTGLPTRKVRELAEAALRDKRDLEVQYHREKVNYNRYGYPSSTKGKVVSEKLEPKEISYDGSTPYLEGATIEEGEPRRIRLGYVLGIAVL